MKVKGDVSQLNTSHFSRDVLPWWYCWDIIL